MNKDEKGVAVPQYGTASDVTCLKRVGSGTIDLPLRSSYLSAAPQISDTALKTHVRTAHAEQGSLRNPLNKEQRFGHKPNDDKPDGEHE